MNIEINITYENLDLLLLCLSNLDLIHDHWIRFYGSLFIRCCFPRKRSKAGDRAFSTLKSLPHQYRTVNTDTKLDRTKCPLYRDVRIIDVRDV